MWLDREDRVRGLHLVMGALGALALLAGTAQGAPFGAEAGQTASIVTASDETGLAAWYGESFDGRTTAAGERFDMYALTAAHPSLPFNTLIEVTNLDNGRSVVVRVNDRPEPASGDLVVVSKAAASSLGFTRAPARVRIAVLAPAAARQPEF